MTGDRRDFLAEVGWLHHEHHLTQEEIARRLDVSRSTISRALADAERQGIVQVVVTVPIRRESRLATDLAAQLGVAAAVGVRVGDEQPSMAAARAAARLVERIADAGHATLAVSWGRTLAATARMVRPRATTGVLVVDAVGHPGGERMVPAVDVTRMLAAPLGASVVHLPSPAFVAPGPSFEVLMRSDPVRRALDAARAADVTLVSVGVAGEDSLLRLDGAISKEVMVRLVRAGAVGEILGRWYDAAGRDVVAVSYASRSHGTVQGTVSGGRFVLWLPGDDFAAAETAGVELEVTLADGRTRVQRLRL